MNELISQAEGFEQALESTTQHYFTLHSDLRLEILAIVDEADRINARISLHREAEYENEVRQRQSNPNTQATPESEPDTPRVKPASKDMKETYRRICNMCHPDKTGHTDSVLVGMMQEAKEALRRRDSDLINSIYDRVKMYQTNPVAYNAIEKEARREVEMSSNPWCVVYEYHLRGDTENAFHESRRILSYNLAQRRIDILNLRLFAEHLGVEQ